MVSVHAPEHAGFQALSGARAPAGRPRSVLNVLDEADRGGKPPLEVPGKPSFPGGRPPERLPAHKIGRLWKFKLSEVDEWVRAEGASEDPTRGDR